MASWVLLLLTSGACGQGNNRRPDYGSPSATFSEPVDRGAVSNPAIDEASGLVASRHHAGVLWTHNDSGDEPKIYPISTAGKTLGEWTLEGARNLDWEDITIGPGPEEGVSYLYVGDIGDNKGRRPRRTIYRFPEPKMDDEHAGTGTVKEVEAIAFQYPDGPRDAETLLLDPFTRDLYIVSKRDEFPRVYRLPYPQSTSGITTAEYLGEWPRQVVGVLNQPVGGDLSPDGQELLIKSYVEVMRWRREDEQTTLFELLKTEPEVLPYLVEPQGEAIGWASDMSGYYTLSEKQSKVIPHLYFYRRTVK